MKIAVYPGSFDPVTNGHLNIINRASRLFDRVIVCVMVNCEKKPLFTLEERKSHLARVTAGLPNVTVDSDFEKEFQMAMINRKLNPQLDSLFLTAEHQYMYLSSSAIKEMGYYNADLTDLLPAEIIGEFKDKISQRRRNKEEQR